MATKTAIEEWRADSDLNKRAGARRTGRMFPAMRWAYGTNFTRFLSDVRAEMRKVVAPSRKEVQATTSVVIVTVFIFGVFFFVVDLVFNRALH